MTTLIIKYTPLSSTLQRSSAIHIISTHTHTHSTKQSPELKEETESRREIVLSHAPVLQLSLFFDWSLAATLAALVVGRQFSPAFLLLPLFLVSGVVAVVSPAAVAPRPLPCSSNDEHGRLHSAITFFGCGIFYPIPASGTQFFFLYFILFTFCCCFAIRRCAFC